MKCKRCYGKMYKTSSWKMGSYFVECVKCGTTDLIQDKTYQRKNFNNAKTI